MADIGHVVAVVEQPAAAVTLVGLVTYMFSRGPKHHPYAIIALAAAAVLGLTKAAHWIVQPAAAICVAVLFSYVWRRPRRAWRPLSRAVVGIIVFALLGVSWVLWPAAGLAVAFFFTHGGGRGGCGGRARRRKVRVDAATQTIDAVVVPQADLHALANDIRVPKDCRVMLRELLDRCGETRAYLVDRGLNEGRHGYVVDQIEHSYAPEAVRAYLSLPPTKANVTPLQDGKTGHQLLVEQLDLLLQAVQDELTEATTIGGEDLMASYRFLKDKFGRSDDLNL